jgi:hypothetical protein
MSGETMIATAPRPRAFSTYLSPGQRFQSADQLTKDVTVARLVTDNLGLLHVTLRSDDGHEVSAFAEQVEFAIAEGHLTPVLASPLSIC